MLTYQFANKYCFGAVAVFAILFAVFPLTDTDIWWHLTCAREWVTTWTPVREPVVNVHEYFQQIVALVYNVGGSPLLVAFKAVLWGVVFALFLWPSVRSLQKNDIANTKGVKQSIMPLALFAVLLFVFRFHLEMRPVVFSLVFLGIYWNVLPSFFEISHSGMALNCSDCFHKTYISKFLVALALLVLQWVWCKCQGLYILGPIFASIVFGVGLFDSWKKEICTKNTALQVFFVILLFAIPLMHREGLNLFLYPFGLLNRLLGMSPSAVIFASEIAENRSPFTLLMVGENVLESMLMIVLCIIGLVVGVMKLRRPDSCVHGSIIEVSRTLWLFIAAILALIAERNFVLFLPVFFAEFLDCKQTFLHRMASLDLIPLGFKRSRLISGILTTKLCLLIVISIAFLLGLWVKSLSSYDSSIAYQRVPVAATEWMKNHPHQGRLFNDDRAGGYLAFVNPSDSIFIDGRFILKTADFFERYLNYSESPQLFFQDADSLNIDRVVLPLRYYARWNLLISSLDSDENWNVSYRDSFFVVIDRQNH